MSICWGPVLWQESNTLTLSQATTPESCTASDFICLWISKQYLKTPKLLDHNFVLETSWMCFGINLGHFWLENKTRQGQIRVKQPQIDIKTYQAISSNFKHILSFADVVTWGFPVVAGGFSFKLQCLSPSNSLHMISLYTVGMHAVLYYGYSHTIVWSCDGNGSPVHRPSNLIITLLTAMGRVWWQPSDGMWHCTVHQIKDSMYIIRPYIYIVTSH